MRGSSEQCRRPPRSRPWRFGPGRHRGRRQIGERLNNHSGAVEWIVERANLIAAVGSFVAFRFNPLGEL